MHVSQAKADMTGFFRDLLDGGLSLRVRVTGRSMAPFLKGGEVVTIKKVPQSELRRGDLVFVGSHPCSPVLHRLIRKKKVGKGRLVFQTRGDALRSFDPPVLPDDILGKVCKIERSCPGAVQIHMDSSIQRKINYFRALVNLCESFCYYGCLRLFRQGILRRRNTRCAAYDSPLPGRHQE